MSMIIPAKKKRITAITNGCAYCKPILVVTEADGHKRANKIPAISNLIFLLKDIFKLFY